MLKIIHKWLSVVIFMPFLSLHRTYEMELHLDDPKSKEDDMGVIIVDVCLMFRDATIKRSPVSISDMRSICWCKSLFLVFSELFVLILVIILFSIEMATKEE